VNYQIFAKFVCLKIMGMPYVILMICLALALALQLLTGGFPVLFFSFPLNLILAVLWLIAMLWCWKKKSKSLFVRFMLSGGATIWAVGLFLLSSLLVGISGWHDFTTSWVFVVVMLYFQSVLLFVILRGWRSATATGARLGSIRWRFLINHAGILLAVSSAFWGAPDSETLRLQAVRELPVKEAFRMDGSSAWLPYEIMMTDFKVDSYENGVPSMFEAGLIVDGKNVTLRVNEPYSRSFGEDIYLTGYDTSGAGQVQYCIIQVVREPWKYFALAGVIMMLVGAFLLFAGGPQRRYGEDD
jgi:hypothetical protein